jgi:hypothetical protein
MIKRKTSSHNYLLTGTFTILVLLILTACEKVINVDLNEAAPRIVIEGLIDDGPGPYKVLISKSASFFNQPTLPIVSGAIVIIEDNTGITDTLAERAPGVYVTSKTRGIPGRVYTLTVLYDNNEYTGTSTMMKFVDIDSLSLVKTETQHFNLGGSSGNEKNVSVYCYFRDPPEKNFYRLKVYSNDTTNFERYRLYDDQYTNGEETELRVGYAEAGDSLKVELLSLDKSTYGYYRTLADLIYSNPVFGSTPANPDSNLSNGALGYFGTCTVSARKIAITNAMIEVAQ